MKWQPRQSVSTDEVAQSNKVPESCETKELTLRLAKEWFGIPKTTVYQHIARKYAKFGAGRPGVGAVLDERTEKHRIVLPIATSVYLCNRSH